MRIYSEKLRQIEGEFGEFDINHTIGSSQLYFRFGYWSRIDIGRLQELLGDTMKVEEASYYDDDCGDMFSYHVKDNF